MPERRQRDHEIGLVERRARGDRVGAIEFGLGAEDDVGLARVLEHRPCIETFRLRQCARDVASDAARGFGEAAERGTGDLAKRLCECPQLRRVGVLFRAVAEQHGLALAREKSRRDDLRRGGRLDLRQRLRHRLAGSGRRGDHDLGEQLRPLRRRRDQRVRDANQRIVRHRSGAATLARRGAPPCAAVARAADGPCAGNCRPRARGRGARRPRSASRATRCRRPARRRGNPTGAAESRCCPNRARARASPRAPSLRPSHAATRSCRSPRHRASRRRP